MPVFFDAWELTNTEAGWIAGIFFAGYAVGVPVLVALTDRIDARWVFAGGALLAAVSSFGFAWLAQGFWSAMAFRTLAGAALGATYMPGLRVLVDRYQGPKGSRAVAFYTSSFSLGTALSFLIAGEVAAVGGWQWAFVAAGVAAAGAAVIAVALRPVQPEAANDPGALMDFRPVLRNRPAMGYVLGYAVHCWELFTMRSWLVAFLAFGLVAMPAAGWPTPTTVAMLSGLVAMVASVGGNELCVRFGRRRVITLVMISSTVMAFGFGFAAPLGYGVLIALALIYSIAVQMDSAALTAGAVAVATPGRRGATMAVHSLIGFGCAFVGPLALGVVLDLSGGAETSLSWGLAFASVGVVGLFGPLAMRLERVQFIPGHNLY